MDFAQILDVAHDVGAQMDDGVAASQQPSIHDAASRGGSASLALERRRGSSCSSSVDPAARAAVDDAWSSSASPAKRRGPRPGSDCDNVNRFTGATSETLGAPDDSSPSRRSPGGASPQLRAVCKVADPVQKLKIVFDYLGKEMARLHKLTLDLDEAAGKHGKSAAPARGGAHPPGPGASATGGGAAAATAAAAGVTGSNFFFMSDAELVSRLMGSTGEGFFPSSQPAPRDGGSSSTPATTQEEQQCESEEARPTETSASDAAAATKEGHLPEGEKPRAAPAAGATTTAAAATSSSGSSPSPKVDGAKRRQKKAPVISPRTPFHALRLFKYLPDKVRTALTRTYLVQAEKGKAQEKGSVTASASSASASSASGESRPKSEQISGPPASPRTLLRQIPPGRKFVLHSEEVITNFFYEFVLWVSDEPTSSDQEGTSGSAGVAGKNEQPGASSNGVRRVNMGWMWRRRDLEKFGRKNSKSCNASTSRGPASRRDSAASATSDAASSTGGAVDGTVAARNAEGLQEITGESLKTRLPDWLEDTLANPASPASSDSAGSSDARTQNPQKQINDFLDRVNVWWRERNDFLDTALRDVKTRLLVWLQQEAMERQRLALEQQRIAREKEEATAKAEGRADSVDSGTPPGTPPELEESFGSTMPLHNSRAGGGVGRRGRCETDRIVPRGLSSADSTRIMAAGERKRPGTTQSPPSTTSTSLSGSGGPPLHKGGGGRARANTDSQMASTGLGRARAGSSSRLQKGGGGGGREAGQRKPSYTGSSATTAKGSHATAGMPSRRPGDPTGGTVDRFFTHSRKLEAQVDVNFEDVRSGFDFRSSETSVGTSGTAAKTDEPGATSPNARAAKGSTCVPSGTIATRKQELTANSPKHKFGNAGWRAGGGAANQPGKKSTAVAAAPAKNLSGELPVDECVDERSAAVSTIGACAEGATSEDSVFGRLLGSCDVDRCKAHVDELIARFDGQHCSFDKHHAAILRLSCDSVGGETGLELTGKWEWVSV